MECLIEKRCLPGEGYSSPLTLEHIKAQLAQIQGWKIDEDGTKIYKNFNFENYYQTISFVNAIAWIAHQENHHPCLIIEYNGCTVQYWTHTINGISENDFICAAKVDSLCSTIF